MLFISLILPHLHLLYRLARPCTQQVWLSKRMSIINTLLLVIIFPLIFMLLPMKIKLVLAGIVSLNTLPGMGLYGLNLFHAFVVLAMFAAIVAMLLALF